MEGLFMTINEIVKKGIINLKEKNIEEKELLINTEAFEELGGKYILSRCKISNAEELNLKLYLDMDSEDSIYHVFVYTIEK